jgi:hypothetical protein
LQRDKVVVDHNVGLWPMQSVEVSLDIKDPHVFLREMKEWIDQIGFTPTRFNYEINDAGGLSGVRVDFPSAVEADIFRGQFCS